MGPSPVGTPVYGDPFNWLPKKQPHPPINTVQSRNKAVHARENAGDMLHQLTFAIMDQAALARLLKEIETQLGWGSAAAWSTADFETLGERIHEGTGVQLSATTLKRVWGRVAYKSSPSPTTLDALANYQGHESWRAYAAASFPAPATDDQDVPLPDPDHAQPMPKADRVSEPTTTVPFWRSYLVLGVVLMLLALSCFYILNPAPAAAPTSAALEAPVNPNDYTFLHRPVSEGLPNSVVFNYDATAAPVDSVYIQQSWDDSRRAKVDRAGKVHTSIYYLPGYYRATLRVGNRVVKSRELLITSNGWTVAAGDRDGPVYLDNLPNAATGSLSVEPSRLADLGLPLQPNPPTVYMGNVGQFNGLRYKIYRWR